MRRTWGFAAVVAGLAVGCSGPTAGSAHKAASHPLVILAASSLKRPLDAFLGSRKDRHRVSYAGSQDLAAQIIAGAPADVFIAAGPKYMDQLVEKGFIERNEVRPVAQNKLAIVFRSDLQPPLTTFHDLQRRGLRVIVGAAEVPIGRAAQEFLSNLDVLGTWDRRTFDANVKSYEQSDLALVAKVRLGEADAAIVYASDAMDEPTLRVVDIPDNLNVVVTYFAAPLVGAQNLAAAKKFVGELSQVRLEGLLPKPGG